MPYIPVPEFVKWLFYIVLIAVAALAVMDLVCYQRLLRNGEKHLAAVKSVYPRLFFVRQVEIMHHEQIIVTRAGGLFMRPKTRLPAGSPIEVYYRPKSRCAVIHEVSYVQRCVSFIAFDLIALMIIWLMFTGSGTDSPFANFLRSLLT